MSNLSNIEFKNLETLEIFNPFVNEALKSEISYTSKCKRILVLQKAGLCSSPVEPAEEV